MGEDLKNPVIKNQHTGQIVELIQSPFTIGRALGCDFVTENKVTSRRHCTLTKTEDGRWTLTDLSTNGTLLNGNLIKNGETSAPLEHKDTFSTGEIWEFLTQTEPPDPINRVQRDDETSPTPSPGFDENGVSDEVLLNLVNQVEQQLENDELIPTNQNNTKIDNTETTSTKTDLHTSNTNDASDQQNKEVTPSNIVPMITEDIPSSLNEKQSLPVNPESNNFVNIPSTSKVNAVASNLIASSSNVATEAYISPENSNKKLKIVSAAPVTANKTIVIPSISTSNVAQPKITTKILLSPEQIKALKNTGQLKVGTKCIVYRPPNIPMNVSTSMTANVSQSSKSNTVVSSTETVTASNNNPTNRTSVNINSVATAIVTNNVESTTNITSVTINSAATTIVTSNVASSTETQPKVSVPPSNNNATNRTPVNINPVATTNVTNNDPIIDIANIPIVISDNPIPMTDENVQPTNVPNVPIIDITRTTEPEPIVVNVPAPVSEIVVETSHEPVSSVTKVHYSQEPGPCNVPQNKKEQNQFNEMEDELLCTICANLFIKTVTLGCSHSFCQYCIEMWKKKKSECPICRNKITSSTRTLVLDNVIEKMIESADDEMKQTRKEAIEEREKIEKDKEEERKKKEEANNQGNTARRGRGFNNRGRGGGQPIQRNNSGNQANQNNQTNNSNNRNNNPPVVQAPAPASFITIADSPSTTSDDSDSEDEEHGDDWYDDYNNDEWYNGRPGAYYGGYGSCFICGDRGHWANGCPYRS